MLSSLFTSRQRLCFSRIRVSLEPYPSYSNLQNNRSSAELRAFGNRLFSFNIITLRLFSDTVKSIDEAYYGDQSCKQPCRNEGIVFAQQLQPSPNRFDSFVTAVGSSTKFCRNYNERISLPSSHHLHHICQRRLLKLEYSRVCILNSQQVRLLCSTRDGDSKHKDTDQQIQNETEKESNQAPPSESSRMDADFVKYLVADVNDEDHPNRMNRRRIRSNVVFSGMDRDKAMYKQVLQASYLQKEKARLQTAKNVYRALCGNIVICLAKLGAWLSSGSSAMMAEFIHSVVDCGNQSLLLIGLRDAQLAPDRKHPYGYGKSVYFWALVSALGTFFLGAGVSMTHAIGELMNPSLHVIPLEVWLVLAVSFAVDGYVVIHTIKETYATKPKNMSYWSHVANIRDPATLAILLEDAAACLGILIAMGGIGLSHATSNPIFDGMAGVAISSLLGTMGIVLVRVNHRFLLGQAVDKEIVDDIGKILQNRRSIDSIGSVQSQWTGPETFSYKAEVDFDGTYLAAKLMPVYQHEFLQIRDTMDQDLQVLLAFYAEDVMRTVEREVRHVEAQIRKKYPGAEYIELEPMSLDVDRLAIDENIETGLRRVERESLDRYLKSLKKEAASDQENEKND